VEINIKIEAPALVDAINALAVAIAGNMELLLYNLDGQSAEAPIPFTVVEEPAISTAGGQAESPDTEEPPAITIDEIRKAFIEKNKDRTNTPKLKALLSDYKVKKVTDLPEQHFQEILKKLEEI